MESFGHSLNCQRNFTSLQGFGSLQTSPLRAIPLARKQQRCGGFVTRMSLKASPAELTVRTFDGGEAGKASLALQIADPAKSTGLVHRYVVTIRQNARQGSANTKTRAEVRGGGKKPYAQKGTGNARQGSRRTPLKPGGGVIFGPKPKDYTIKMNKKERRLALSTALQSAAEAITVVEDLKSKVHAALQTAIKVDGARSVQEHVTEPKTKLVTSALSRLGVDSKEYVLLVVDELSEAMGLATRNIERLTVNRASALNAYDICRADRIIMESSALKYIQQFYSRDAEEAVAA